jgi:hypothetical protein
VNFDSNNSTDKIHNMLKDTTHKEEFKHFYPQYFTPIFKFNELETNVSILVECVLKINVALKSMIIFSPILCYFNQLEVNDQMINRRIISCNNVAASCWLF